VYRWPNGWIDEAAKAKNRTKSKVRAKVEHVIGVIKRVFGFTKTRYRGLAKNLHRLEAMAALTNLLLMRRRLVSRWRADSTFKGHTGDATTATPTRARRLRNGSTGVDARLRHGPDQPASRVDPAGSTPLTPSFPACPAPILH